MPDRTYIAIDLKSFYASVECVERGLDPMTTHLVVADESRTEKTICLAVSPSLKAHGIPGRPRLFEVVQQVGRVNIRRLKKAPGQAFSGSSFDDAELKADPSLELDYIIARPRMALYVEYSTRIYDIYMHYAAPEDIHVYSIDEVFIDATRYIATAGVTAREYAMSIIRDVLRTTGITATVGIGTNLYLCKVALDIEAKRTRADKDGVRIAELDEMSYRRKLWDHRPLTDFWRVGRGYAKKLEGYGMFTMGDIARCSLGGPRERLNEELLYKLFGVNAQLLIDHAWGWEPCTMADIKAYRPETNSLSSGQVLHCPYDFDKCRIIVREMADMLTMDLLDKGLVTDQIVLTVGYDAENLSDPRRKQKYHGPVTTDHYGRKIPKHAHGTVSLGRHTCSENLIINAAVGLFDRIADRDLLVRRVYVVAGHVMEESRVPEHESYQQLDIFTDQEAEQKRLEAEAAALNRERHRQEAVLDIRRRYGKNAILKGVDFEEGATARDRNRQIGGHRA